jgi:LacI family transcriptional regulator
MAETISAPNSRITITDVAFQAKVSPGTVSRVLNNVSNVDEAIRGRVLEAVRSLNYIHIPKRRGGISFENSNSNGLQLKSIVMCVREMETPAPRNVYYSHVLHGAETECTRNNVNMVYFSVKDTAASLSEIEAVMRRGHADGLLLVGLNNQYLVENILKLGVPVTVVNNQFTDLTVDSVTSDFYQGTLLAIRHLSGLGHRDIIFIQGPDEDYSVQRRIEGYRIGLIQSNLDFRPELVFETAMTISGGEEVGRQILKSRLKFTAICCANDAIAIGVIRTLTAAGVAVPDQVSVIGFDDVDVATLISPPLTTIQSDIEALGSIAVERLVQRAVREDRPYQHTVMPVKLVIRGSTAPIQL